MSIETNQVIEARTLRVNFILSLIYVLFSLVIVYFAQSLTVLLDVGYSVITIFIYASSLYVVKKINQPANKRYPYGYHRLEPVFVFLQSSFVLMVAASVILMACINLVMKVITPNYLFALLASLVGTITCYIMYLYVQSAAKKTGSRILRADAALWKADALLSLSVNISLAVAFILSLGGMKHLAGYVDPIVAIAMGIFITIKPLKLMKEAGLNLLDASVKPEVHTKITEVAHLLCGNYSFDVQKVIVTQSGRFLFVDLRLKVPASLSMQEIRNLKARMLKSYKEQFKKNVIYVYINI